MAPWHSAYVSSTLKRLSKMTTLWGLPAQPPRVQRSHDTAVMVQVLEGAGTAQCTIPPSSTAAKCPQHGPILCDNSSISPPPLTHCYAPLLSLVSLSLVPSLQTRSFLSTRLHYPIPFPFFPPSHLILTKQTTPPSPVPTVSTPSHLSSCPTKITTTTNTPPSSPSR